MVKETKVEVKEVENPTFGPTEEVTSVWHIVLRNGKEYDLITDWANLGAALAAIQDTNPEHQFIGGLTANPIQLDLEDGQDPLLYNFVMIRNSEIVSVAGSF